MWLICLSALNDEDVNVKLAADVKLALQVVVVQHSGEGGACQCSNSTYD